MQLLITITWQSRLELRTPLKDGLILTRFIIGKDVTADLTAGSFWFLSDYFA